MRTNEQQTGFDSAGAGGDTVAMAEPTLRPAGTGADAPARQAAAQPPATAIVHGMPNGEYHRCPALGSSTLKQLARSPFHAWALGVDPNRPPSVPTAAMFAGTLAHCMVLEIEQFHKRYVVKPDGHDGRTRDGKAWATQIAASGMELITPEQLQTAQRQAAAIRALPEIASLLDGPGASEVSAFWKRDVVDEQTGEVTVINCKCRPDRVCDVDARSVVLIDVKTARDASADGFARAIWNYRYDIQDVWYCDGFEKASGLMVLAMVFVVIESDFPHAAAAYVLDDEAKALARDDIERLARTYAKCKRTGQWPGYPETVQAISLPAWVRR